MERTYICDVKTVLGERIKVQGFVENFRNSRAMAFIVLKDITGKLQITVEKEKSPELCEILDQITGDSVITAIGQVVENEYVKLGGLELIPEELRLESIAEPIPITRKEIPATKKKQAVERSSIDQRIDYRWIDLRTDEKQRPYIGNEDKLPYDMHFFGALIAPRFYLQCEGMQDYWINPKGAWMNFCGVKEAYRHLGCEDNAAAWFREGSHRHSVQDFSQFFDFMVAKINGKPTAEHLKINPYPDLDVAQKW